jgi:hypothetical protein
LFDPAWQLLPGRTESSSSLVPLFNMAMALWGTLMLEGWKRHNARRAFEWGVHDVSKAPDARRDVSGCKHHQHHHRHHHRRRHYDARVGGVGALHLGDDDDDDDDDGDDNNNNNG